VYYVHLGYWKEVQWKGKRRVEVEENVS